MNTTLFSFFLFHILIEEEVLLISEPQASAGMGARLLCLFSLLHGMFVVWIWWCKTALLEVGSLGAWLHNPKQTGSEMQNPRWWFTVMLSLGEGKSAAGMWAAPAAPLVGLELQSRGIFGVTSRVVTAAATHNPWAPSVDRAHP